MAYLYKTVIKEFFRFSKFCVTSFAFLLKFCFNFGGSFYFAVFSLLFFFKQSLSAIFYFQFNNMWKTLNMYSQFWYNFLGTESPLKLMKNIFYFFFIFLVLKIFKFLSWRFGMLKNGLIKKIRQNLCHNLRNKQLQCTY